MHHHHRLQKAPVVQTTSVKYGCGDVLSNFRLTKTFQNYEKN